MVHRSRLRRGISLEVIFEEEDHQSLNEWREVGSISAVTSSRRGCHQGSGRYADLDTVEETQSDDEAGLWEDREDPFHRGDAVFSRSRILKMAQLFTNHNSENDERNATMLKNDSSWRRTEVRSDEEADTDLQARRFYHRRPRRPKSTDFLRRYRMSEDLLVNDNIIIVDTSTNSSSAETSDATGFYTNSVSSSGSKSRSGEENDTHSSASLRLEATTLVPEDTVKRTRSQFERLAAEPDSYLLWKDTTRLSGVSANPSSKILRRHEAAGQDPTSEDRQLLHRQLLDAMFRRRLADLQQQQAKVRHEGGTNVQTARDCMTKPDETARTKPEVNQRMASQQEEVQSGQIHEDSVRQVGDGVRVTQESLTRIRRQGVSVSYLDGRRTLPPSWPVGCSWCCCHCHTSQGQERPLLCQLVDGARRNNKYLAVATAPGATSTTGPALAHTLPASTALRRNCHQQMAPQCKSLLDEFGQRDWRQTGRSYVFNFSNQPHRTRPPVRIQPRPTMIIR